MTITTPTEPTFEPLEQRRLLAGHALDIESIPAFKPTTTDLADVKRGPMANAGQSLVGLYLDYRRAVKSGRQFSTSDASLDVKGDRVGLTLRIRGYSEKFIKGLEKAYGFEVVAKNAKYQTVQGYVSINWVRELAARRDVAQIAPIYKPVGRTQGVADNQADLAMNVATARTAFDLDGSGVKVGVLSDSINRVGNGLSDSVASGDLPAGVQILEDGEVGEDDEGRAMLEQIHDLVPGASLAFATAHLGQQNFADNIRLLKSSGSTVIVDDVGYPDEPFFQEGVIDEAIRDVVSGGAVYATAAGNDAEGGFEQAAQFTASGGRTLIDFNPGAAIDTRMTIVVSDFDTFVLQWANPYNGLTGNATADLDIRLYQVGTNTVRASGLSNNLATGRPIESFNVAPGAYEVEIERSALAGGASNPSHFRMLALGGMASAEFTGNRAAAWGHASSAASLSVGAVPFFNAPPFDNTPPIVTEDFSSRGGATYVFDINGDPLATPTVPQKPDISGIDGVNTSFFGDDIFQDNDTLPNFFGTSSAAPNVAAVVAMIRQVNPNVTQDQVIAGLKDTARPTNNTPAGVWDPFGGFGLVDANGAIPIFASPPSVTITPVSPDPRINSISSIQVVFNQRVTGVNRTDFTLSRDGGPNLLRFTNQVTTSDNITYTITNLSSMTSPDGTYTLTLNATGSGITNVLGQPLTTGTSETWTKIPPPPLPNQPTNFQVRGTSANAIEVSWQDNNTVEDGYTVIRATDSAFSRNRKTFHLPANSTSLINSDLSGGTRYYYRVRAFNASGAGKYTIPQSAFTLQNGEIVIDNTSPGVRVRGFWGVGTSGSGYLGPNYLQDGNSAKGTKSVLYRPSFVASGPYYVYARWTRASNRATNAKFDFFYGPDAALRTTVQIDQRNRGGNGWVLVGGPFEFRKGTGAGVRIRNAQTNGYVIADSLRFIAAAPLPVSKGLSYTPTPEPSPFFSPPKQDGNGEDGAPGDDLKSL